MSKIIGIFDSGTGGLSVLAKARAVMPDVNFIYYADTDHVPYGTKSRDEIVGYSMSAADFLVKKGASAILVACNTATSMAVDTLRAAFSCPVVGMEPAVKPAVTKHPHEKILVCATPATIGGEKLRDLLRRMADGGTHVDLAALPELVLFAERGMFDPSVVTAYIRRVIPDADYTACVLGCTHFPYFRDSFRLLFPEAELIDGAEGTVRRLCFVTDYEREAGKGRVSYFQSGRPVADPDVLGFYEMLQQRAAVFTD